jgi:hypothetical protein
LPLKKQTLHNKVVYKIGGRSPNPMNC